MEYKSFMEALKGKQHKIDKNKNGKIDAHDFKLLRKEESEITEAATVKTQKYSWGTMKTVHHGKDFSIPLHPEHHKEIAKLKDEQEHKFKDETGRHWTARRKGNDVHFHSGNDGPKTVVKHSDLKEEVEDRVERSDYKVTPSGRKSHKQIVFTSGDDGKKTVQEETLDEVSPPGFEGTVKAMKKKKEIDNPYALAWSMYKKGYKSHKNPDGTMKEETELEEQAPTAPSLVKHRISVTVSDPDHPMVSKRKEKIQKTVIVTHSDNKEGAKAVGEKYYKKKGFRVHDSHHAGMVNEETKEKKDDLPFTPDEPKKNPPAKAGKYGQGYSTAKHLAKQGMKQAMKEDTLEEKKVPEATGDLKDACWKGYTAVGMKTKNGKKVPNCVPVKEETDTTEKHEMAQTQLHFISYAAEEILEYIDMGGEIEEWYQNKLSKVQSEMESLHSYIEGESRRTGMKEEVESLEERNKQNAMMRKSMDASRGARFKAQGNYTPDPEPQHKTAQAHNKAVGRAIRQMSREETDLEQIETGVLSYKEFRASLDEIKMADLPSRKITGRGYGTEYYKKEREKDERGFDSDDDKPTTQKRGRGRPAGSKSGARGPRIK
jgi:hypothetical protein